MSPQFSAEVAASGSLSAAIARLANDESPLLGEALRVQSEQSETIDQRCFRLGLAAADADQQAERHMDAKADAEGLAAGRRLAGNDDEVARSYDREAAHCLELANLAMAEAERLRSQCRALRRAKAYADDVLASLRVAS